MYNALNPKVIKTELKQLGDLIDHLNLGEPGKYFSVYQSDLESTIYSKIWAELKQAFKPENAGITWVPDFLIDPTAYFDHQPLKSNLIKYRNRLQVNEPSTSELLDRILEELKSELLPFHKQVKFKASEIKP